MQSDQDDWGFWIVVMVVLWVLWFIAGRADSEVVLSAHSTSRHGAYPDATVGIEYRIKR